MDDEITSRACYSLDIFDVSVGIIKAVQVNGNSWSRSFLVHCATNMNLPTFCAAFLKCTRRVRDFLKRLKLGEGSQKKQGWPRILSWVELDTADATHTAAPTTKGRGYTDHRILTKPLHFDGATNGKTSHLICCARKKCLTDLK